MSRLIKVAATQMACDWDIQGNVDRAEQLVREAAGQGAQIILIQELFETPYFCIEQNHKHLGLAAALEESATVKRFSALAKGLLRADDELLLVVQAKNSNMHGKTKKNSQDLHARMVCNFFMFAACKSRRYYIFTKCR